MIVDSGNYERNLNLVSRFMAKKTLSREAKKLAKLEPAKSQTPAKKPVVVPAAPKKMVPPAPPPPAPVAQPEAAAPAVAKPKKKRTRFVREKIEKRTPAEPVALPPPGRTAVGKLMTKNLQIAPKEEPGTHRRGHFG